MIILVSVVPTAIQSFAISLRQKCHELKLLFYSSGICSLYVSYVNRQQMRQIPVFKNDLVLIVVFVLSI